MKTKLPLLLVTLGLSALSVTAQVPGIINHQGKVTVNGTNWTGSGQFKFALVNAAGSTTYWSHDGTSASGAEPTSVVTLPTTRGVFSVNLGDTNVANMAQAIPATMFTNSAVYLRVWFNDGVNGSQLLTPDRQITSVGYAMTAGHYVETDPLFTASVASGISSGQTNNWNIAYGWGNHATAGYLTSYTETDPVFTASVASGITSGQTNNWNTAFGWGNHATAGYLTSFTETDPVFAASAAYGIASGDITAWNAKIDGSGTSGTLSKFTAGSTMGNSIVVESGGNIGIGTNAPSQKLEVNGAIKSASGGFVFPDGTVQTTATTNTASGSSGPTVILQAYLNADQTLAASADTTILFNNVTVNAGNAYSASTGTFTVPSTGIYTIQYSVYSPYDNPKYAKLKKAGALFHMGTYAEDPSSQVVTCLNYTGVLTAGDAITFCIFNNGGASSAYSGPSQAKTSVTVIKW
ncbi:MAG TPA: hypothetical protein VK327_07970 [Candidatus Paceibacterota bacterium]|nr:hypothetical protein [Candidatus Paceibacterota bacterium]